MDGCFRVPGGPGLGVELDEERLATCERLNADEGDLLFHRHEERREPRFVGMW